MNELKPLLQTGAGTHMRDLLEAARADAPPSEFQGRVLVGLGMGAAVFCASTAAAAGTGFWVPAAAAPTVGVSMLVLVKCLAVGAVGGGLLAAGAEAVFRPSPSQSSTAQASTSFQSKSSAPGPAVTTALPDARPPAPPLVDDGMRAATSSSRPSLASASPSASRAGQLGREVRLIDAARREFAAGHFSRAFAELEAYQRIAQTGVLDREARVLRIEILHKAGDAAQALGLREQYLLEFPTDEHAARLRALTRRSP
jgi:hypothetical protein